MTLLKSRKVEISEIPVIDLAQLGQGPAAQSRLYSEMREACETIGFFYAQNHGVPAAAADRVFEQCHRLFALPKAELQEMAMTKSPLYRR
jgi:isopenicillin N synthase-like dioxygenase